MSDYAAQYAAVQALPESQFWERFDLRVLVAGSRGVRDYDYFCQAMQTFDLDELRSSGCMISGVASKGPDEMVVRWAKQNGILCREYPAEWDALGKRAGYVRNVQMGKAATEAVVLWDCVSPGTKHMLKLLADFSVPYALHLLDSEETKPSTVKEAQAARTCTTMSR